MQRSFAKLEKLYAAPADELTSALRAAAATLNVAEATIREDGLFELTLDGRVWLVSPDGQSLIGVRTSKGA